MVKRIFTLLLALLLAALCGMTAFADDLGAGTRRVFDECALFSEMEEEHLEEVIAALRAETGMDFVVLTSDEATYSADDAEAGKYSMAVADDFYDYNGFGAGEAGSGLLYLIDMSNRVPTISTKGEAIDLVDDRRLREMLDTALEELSAGDFVGSAYEVARLFQADCAAGVPEGQYQYDTETGEQLTERHKRLTTGEMLFAGGVAAVTVLVFWLVISGSYRLRGSTYHYDPYSSGELRITDRSDRYLTTQVHRVRRQRNQDSGGGGGFDGGSGVHTSSSGSSHGGGSGGRF